MMYVKATVFSVLRIKMEFNLTKQFVYIQDFTRHIYLILYLHDLEYLKNTVFKTFCLFFNVVALKNLDMFFLQ